MERYYQLERFRNGLLLEIMSTFIYSFNVISLLRFIILVKKTHRNSCAT